MELDDFIARVSQRPLPDNPVARIRTLAKELAEGAVEELWETYVLVEPGFEVGTGKRRWLAYSERVDQYLKARWEDTHPDFSLLEGNGFMVHEGDTFELTPAAFKLVEAVEAASVFVSYRRSQSSAFALLVLARLKEHGIDAFLDLTIQPGDDWRDHLRKQISSREYMVLLLGKDTLKSDVVLEEIDMAMEARLTILPIWHDGFVYRPGEWENLPVKIDKLLSSTHTIRVLEESALAYNNAIVELLNRFGVTP